MISAELMYEKVMHRMDMTKETKEEELQEIIRTVLEDESKKEFIPLSEKIRLSIRGRGPSPLIKDIVG